MNETIMKKLEKVAKVITMLNEFDGFNMTVVCNPEKTEFGVEAEITANSFTGTLFKVFGKLNSLIPDGNNMWLSPDGDNIVVYGFDDGEVYALISVNTDRLTD